MQKYAEARADFAAKVAFDATREAGGSETAAKQVTAHISNPWPRSLRRTLRGRHTVCTVPHRRPRRHGLTRWRTMLMNGVNILRRATLTDPHAGTGHTNQGAACGDLAERSSSRSDSGSRCSRCSSGRDHSCPRSRRPSTSCHASQAAPGRDAHDMAAHVACGQCSVHSAWRPPCHSERLGAACVRARGKLFQAWRHPESRFVVACQIQIIVGVGRGHAVSSTLPCCRMVLISRHADGSAGRLSVSSKVRLGLKGAHTLGANLELGKPPTLT